MPYFINEVDVKMLIENKLLQFFVRRPDTRIGCLVYYDRFDTSQEEWVSAKCQAMTDNRLHRSCNTWNH